MTVILDNGQMFRITKIMGVEAGRPVVDTLPAGPLAVFFEPSNESSVFSRGWWWVSDASASVYLLDDTVSMKQKEQRLLKLMSSGSNNRWYRYTGIKDRNNADLIPQEKGE